MIRKIFRVLKTLLLISAMLALGACATKVERISPDQVRDLSNWNDTDSQLVSEEMISDVLSRAWLQNFQQAHSKQPAVIVGEIRNLSHEHINMNTFVGDMERALINSGKVEERKDQDINAREDTRKAMGMEQGADFMLKGQINTILDAEGKEQVRYYQIDLTLISLTDNRIVWVGQKKIKKFITKGSLRP